MKNVTLRLHRHVAGNPDNYVGLEDRAPIQGTGKIDARFDWSLRYLGAKTRSWSSDISSAAGVEEFHANYSKCFGDGDIELTFPHHKLSIEQFIEFRDTEIQKLPVNSQLADKSNYTTAKVLRAEDLIPAEYVVAEPVLAPLSVPPRSDAGGLYFMSNTANPLDINAQLDQVSSNPISATL
jgi:hypothetical protein